MSSIPSHSLDSQTIFLHWLVGLAMLMLLGTGVYMTEYEVYELYDLHKSVGTLIFLVALWRALLRLRNGWPAAVGEDSALQHLIARVVHYVLLIGTLLMPISGFMMSVMGGHDVGVFGLELVAEIPDPQTPGEVLAVNEALAGFAKAMHRYAGYAVIAAVVLHVAGALKHHIVDKDSTLSRMLGGKLRPQP